MKQIDNIEDRPARQSLIKHAQELAARYSETGINPDSFFLFTASEIAGVVVYLKRLDAEKRKIR